MSENHKFGMGAFAIILDKDRKILLCHRTDRDLWNLPGGGVEKGEAPWRGVLREIKEEIGVEAEIKKLTGVYYKSKKNEVIFSFLCNIIGGSFAPTNEADKIEYFKLDEVPENTVVKQLERIRDYFADPDKIWMKNQE